MSPLGASRPSPTSFVYVCARILDAAPLRCPDTTQTIGEPELGRSPPDFYTNTVVHQS
ncbi:hypothetical protein [Rhodococcus sp. A14]|uniref:hypothetical protein n=1 Tax=Rhodococcus sp. A14 TaxID=1194106 RepID=UPI001421899A|nr:hypothetical protein [Rhodococcus sp. A14]